MKAGTRIGATLAAALTVGAIAALPAAQGSGQAPSSEKATDCPLTQSEVQNGLGASYVYTLKVTNLSCEKGKNLVIKFHECRHDNGGRDGTCSGFKGYSCDQKITAEAPSQISARAKCSKGSKRFKQTFGENT